jgi:hypothetical protein
MSWWICYVGFAGSLARPGAFVVVIFSIEIVHYRVLSVDQFVDVGHEVTMVLASASWIFSNNLMLVIPFL